MLQKLEQWWERLSRWYQNKPTWLKVVLFVGFALLAVLLSTAIVLLTMASPEKRRKNTYANTTVDPMVPLLEGNEDIDERIQKALDQAKKEIGDVEVKQERLEAAAKDAHEAIDQAKSPGEIVKIIRRGVYTVIFILLIPCQAFAQEESPGDVFYPLPPGEEIEIDGELYQCFTYGEMQDLGHGYIEYEKLYRLRLDMKQLTTTARNILVFNEISRKNNQMAIKTLTAQSEYYKESLDNILRQHEKELKKKEIEVWVWRVTAGLLALTATSAFIF